jgi:hypothetical protein
MVLSYILFFLLGFGFGFALRGVAPFTALLIPLVLALVTILVNGSDSTVIARLIIALVITAGGVLLGMVLQRVSGEGARAG